MRGLQGRAPETAAGPADTGPGPVGATPGARSPVSARGRRGRRRLNRRPRAAFPRRLKRRSDARARPGLQGPTPRDRGRHAWAPGTDAPGPWAPCPGPGAPAGARADFAAIGTGAGSRTWEMPRTGAGTAAVRGKEKRKRKGPGTRGLRGWGTLPQAARSISYASTGGAVGRLSARSGRASRKLMEPRGPTTTSVV